MGGIGNPPPYSALGPRSNPARVADTIYRNNTGVPLVLWVQLQAAAGQIASYTLTIGPDAALADVRYADAELFTGDALTSVRHSLEGVVPPGYYYRVAAGGANTGTINFWAETELRP